MSVLIAIALKSLLIAGLTIGLLQLMKQRSAAERSWVAHIGLLALVIMALAPLVLPSWHVETPALFAKAPALETPASAPAPVTTIAPRTVSAKPVAPTPAATHPTINAAAAASAGACSRGPTRATRRPSGARASSTRSRRGRPRPTRRARISRSHTGSHFFQPIAYAACRARKDHSGFAAAPRRIDPQR